MVGLVVSKFPDESVKAPSFGLKVTPPPLDLSMSLLTELSVTPEYPLDTTDVSLPSTKQALLLGRQSHATFDKLSAAPAELGPPCASAPAHHEDESTETLICCCSFTALMREALSRLTISSVAPRNRDLMIRSLMVGAAMKASTAATASVTINSIRVKPACFPYCIAIPSLSAG